MDRVEILPYHTLGIPKYEKLGIDYPLRDVDSPSAERVANAKRILGVENYTGWKKELEDRRLAKAAKKQTAR